MNVNFSKHSWHSRLYALAYGTADYPQNLCPYFWQIVVAFLLIPFSFVGYIHEARRKLGGSRLSFPAKIAATMLIYVALLAVWWTGFGINALLSFPQNLWLSFVTGFVFYITVVAMISLGVEIIAYVKVTRWYEIVSNRRHVKKQARQREKDSRRYIREDMPREDNIFAVWVVARYKKMCPHIDWGE